MAQTKEELFKTLDSRGIAKVRSDLDTLVYLNRPQQKLWVIEWIHLFEEAAERSRDATSAEQLALARAAAAEAREANVIARSARRIAMISVVAAIAIAIAGTAVAVIVPHYWH
jgi:hypothetical protein